ncbi:MAG: hypothetical protein DRQ49_10665 [Gammaproteobacteria bacterium]|nr:MAG: hypothetical protein DRQ49_10665 [Gammaproteobacteria bacterium]RKZ75553.1 MAG: hypothetical protein DRQ57_06990 [Gammaproteobacteria bacterium]
MNITHSEPISILKTFEKLRADYQLESAKIATKQDIATRQKDKEIVEQASTYTADSIFQDLAKLQSIFGQSVDGLVKDMTTEVEKLAQIRRAILVENQHLTSLQNTQVAAEALNILQQEHQKELQSLGEDYQKKHDALEVEMTSQREIWQKQQQDHEKAKTKQHAQLDKNRQFDEEDFDYKLKWQHTEDSDDYEKHHRALERQLAEEDRRKQKDWQERESFLEKHQTEFDEYKTKVESIPKEVEEAVKKSREAAIKEAYKDEENKAKLLEKEREAKRKAFELKTESLNKIADEQKLRIAQLSEQLQVASQQMQQLSMTAVSSAGQAEKNQ